MDKAVSAADANRRFSELLREVKKGHSYLVTSHGRPIAKIIPVEEDTKTNSSSRSLLLKRLRSQRAVNIGHWTRSELYENER